ncbi:MAG: hypothetical protein KGH88_06530 [Thaumarchaeota archaeon]|nr:hypothetical protein [Nitrososphaerota archaeon]
MSETELARQICCVVMLSVASYSDIKRRHVSDIVWLIFGGIGAATYIFDPPSHDAILYIVCGIAIAIACLRIRMVGQADCLALVALAVTFPVFVDIPVVPLVAVATPVLASVFSLCYNLSCNISDLVFGRLFSGICEKPHRKALAFILLHRKRKYEKFVFQAQDGCRFVFSFRKTTGCKFADDFEGYVGSAVPLMPFMLAALVMMLFLGL